MSQLVIIDIQTRFLGCGEHEIYGRIHENFKNYSLLFVMDILEDDELDFPENFFLLKDNHDEEEYEYEFDPLSYPRINKMYGFFRDLMDEGEEDEVIIALGKWMLKHNVGDMRDIEDDDELTADFKESFKNQDIVNADFNSYMVTLPFDLIEDIQKYIIQGCTLAGGGRNECLREFSLLLHVLDIKHTIDEYLTYS